ncbi:MAG: transcriptional regulator [Rhodospirillales bacterium]|nr:transcriptional regulator [Rhodospirillales bacterium]
MTSKISMFVNNSTARGRDTIRTGADGHIGAVQHSGRSSALDRNADAVEIPLIRPNPPSLSSLTKELLEIENRGIYANYGPVNSRLEEQFVRAVFKASGACVTVANATLGLMLAIKQAVGWQPRGRYALMPSFTFAAAAHAALWCGLTPLFCDIDPETWLPDADAEEALLKRYGNEIAVILPNATFGNCLDLPRYHRLSAAHGVPLVIDAASSLGSLDQYGEAFGMGSAHPLVFSMHATKSFATAEGGLVYCTDQGLIACLRNMGNFGFGQPRVATMPGLNSKLSEVAALLALTKLRNLEPVAEHRQALYELYCKLLPEFTFQRMTGCRTAHQIVSVLVPEEQAGHVPELVAQLARRGIGSGRYFVPHLAAQPFFQQTCVADDLTVTEAIAGRVIALPMSDFLTANEVGHVCDIFRQVCHQHPTRRTRAGSLALNGVVAGGLL